MLKVSTRNILAPVQAAGLSVLSKGLKTWCKPDDWPPKGQNHCQQFRMLPLLLLCLQAPSYHSCSDVIERVMAADVMRSCLKLVEDLLDVMPVLLYQVRQAVQP